MGARSTRCQLEQWSGSAAPLSSPHGGPAGVGGGGMRIHSLDTSISNHLKASLIIRTAHAPSHAPSPALALILDECVGARGSVTWGGVLRSCEHILNPAL